MTVYIGIKGKIYTQNLTSEQKILMCTSFAKDITRSVFDLSLEQSKAVLQASNKKHVSDKVFFADLKKVCKWMHRLFGFSVSGCFDITTSEGQNVCVDVHKDGTFRFKPRDLKFICPHCKQESLVGIHMIACVVNVPILVISEEAVESYAFPEIEESSSQYYYCRKCLHKLPVEASEDDSTLIDYLKKKKYNKVSV